MGGGNLANPSKKKGFAISGILYPLLILTLFLVVQMLFMLQTRKNVLDKARTELAESVNASNKVYTNEELSILIGELQNELKTYKDSNNQRVNKLEGNVPKFKKNFELRKFITKDTNNPKIIISNLASEVLVNIKLYGNYSYINYGGYVEYKLGGHFEQTTIHGRGESIEKKGQLGESIGTISPSLKDATLTVSIPFTKVYEGGTSGSYINADVTVYARDNVMTNVTARIE